jgi:hypothetical protein
LSGGRLLLFALLALPACRPGGGSPAAAKAPEAIVKEVERGPVKVVLRVEPKEPTFAERVRFTIEVLARKGVRVTLPSPGENLGEFIIKDYDAPPESTTADMTRQVRSYVLEFLTSGKYTIPPMTVAFRDERPAGDAAAPAGGDAVKDVPPPAAGGPPAAAPAAPSPEEAPPEFKIVTDEIPVEVKPLADTASLEGLRPIAPPAEPPAAARRLFWPLGIAGAAAAAGLLLWAALRLRGRARPAAPRVPAHERAYAELEWLLGQGLVESGELKDFFFHLSRILREYIENRFGLRAPERTTEEFLEEIGARAGGSGGATRAGGVLLPEHRRLLREFLERADLVKFATYRPSGEEVEASFEAAKRFIEESRERPGAAAPAGAGRGASAAREAVA